MALTVYIEDIFEDLVAEVSAVLGFPVYYQHGSLLEINQNLAQMSQSTTFKSQKFPLVALLHDYPRNKGGQFEQVRLTILIATNTLAEYKADKRLEVNFKPILDPIYNELLKQIHLNNNFLTTSSLRLSHTKIDHYYYGTEGPSGHSATRFNDLVDCIEIRDLELSIYAKNC